MEKSNDKKNIAEVINVRGTGRFYLPDKSFEFVPKKEGQPAQKDVKKYGVAKAYTTTGKEPKRIVTLQVPTDATDPLNELTEQFNKVVRSEYNASESRQLKTQGVALKNEDDARMYLNKKARRIEVSFYVPLDPEEKRDYKTMFYDKIQEISKCLAINETLIQKSR